MSDCIGTGCKADSLLARIAALEAECAALAKDAIPREPTEEMLQVGVDACPLLVREQYANGHFTGTRSSLSSVVLAELWRAMYDAAREKP